MKIHLLSDIHLERGPYTLPPDLEFDVVVVAGDISDNPQQAIDFLASVGKPSIFVPGNHDFWTVSKSYYAPEGDQLVDYRDRLADLRRLTTGTSVHVLECDSVVIGDTRFCGATWWTDLGRGLSRQRNGLPDAVLTMTAKMRMSDYLYIGAQSWLSEPKNISWRKEVLRKLDIDDSSWGAGRFDPLIAFAWHESARKWYSEEMRRYAVFGKDGWTTRGAPWKRTVMITHHAPVWTGMLKTGVMTKESADPRNWDRPPHGDDPGYFRAAAYGCSGSRLPMTAGPHPDLWIHGHVHGHMDYVAEGVRVVSNARGYAYKGSGNAGDGHHDERLVIDLETSRPAHAYLAELQQMAAVFEPLIEEARRFAGYLQRKDSVLVSGMRELAIARLTEIDTRWREFDESLDTEFGGALTRDARPFQDVYFEDGSLRFYGDDKDPRTKILKDIRLAKASLKRIRKYTESMSTSKAISS